MGESIHRFKHVLTPQTVALSLALVLCVIAVLYVISGLGGVSDGHVVERLQFQVVDKVTGKPIARAVVRIRDLHGTGLETPAPLLGEREHGVVGFTNEQGLVTLEYRLPLSARWRTFTRSEVIAFPDWLWLDVEARGYARSIVMLREVAGRGHARSEFPLPSMRVAISSDR